MSEPRKHPDGTGWTSFDYAKASYEWARTACIIALESFVVVIVLLLLVLGKVS